MRRGWLCLLLCLLLMVLPCYAATGDVVRAQADALELDELERQAEEYLGEVDLSQGIDLDEGLFSLFTRGEEEVPGILHKAARSSGLLLVVVLLCSLTEGVLPENGGKGVPVTSMVGVVAVTTLSVADMHTLIGLGREAIGRMEALSKVLLPGMAAVTAAAGAPAGAVARQMATMLFSDLLLTIIHRVLIPMVYAYVAACAAYAALGNDGVKRMAELVKWAVTSILTVLLLAFVAYLSVSGAIAGTSDAAAIKAAKMAVSGMVPVVGGILSDAAETVLAGAGILKGSVGVAGMLAVLAICLIPFLHLGIHYLTYKLTAALTATVSESRVAGLVSSIGGAFGLVLGMTGSCALLLLISMVSAVSGVMAK